MLDVKDVRGLFLSCRPHDSTINHTQKFSCMRAWGDKCKCKQMDKESESVSRIQMHVFVDVLLSQVERWHFSPRWCPTELPAESQFITGSHLSLSASFFFFFYSFIAFALKQHHPKQGDALPPNGECLVWIRWKPGSSFEPLTPVWTLQRSQCLR